MDENIRCTGHGSNSDVDFMDLSILKGAGFHKTGLLDTKLFRKPLNPYLYLPFSSDHPLHVKKGFIKGELIRIARASSTFELYFTDRDHFLKSLRARGYPFHLIEKVASQVTYDSRVRYLGGDRRAKASAPLVLKLPFNRLTFALRPSHRVRTEWNLLGALPHFSRPPIIAYRKGRTLRSHIVRWTPGIHRRRTTRQGRLSL
jgi:hypothetical protein